MSTIRTTSAASPAKTPQTGQMAQSAQTSTPATSTTKPACEHVAKRAYEKWLKRGCVHGHDLQDWVEAEKEVMAEQKGSTTAATSSPAQTKARR